MIIDRYMQHGTYIITSFLISLKFKTKYVQHLMLVQPLCLGATKTIGDLFIGYILYLIKD